MNGRDHTLLRTETFTALAERFNEACVWLKELGLEYPKTRVGRYQKILSKLARHQLDGTLDEAARKVPLFEYINVGFEVHRLLYIYDGLSQVSTAGMLDKLRQAVRGHDLYVFDNEGRSGRDISFELTIAAMFGRVADYIDLDQDADVVAYLDGFPIYVECKRLKSMSNVEARIKEGLRQLENRYKDASNPLMCRGLLALSIDKVANPKFGLLRAKNPDEMNEKIVGAVDGFASTYNALWRQRAGARTLGVLVVLEAPALDSASNKLIIASQSLMDALRPEWSSEFGWLELLAKGAMVLNKGTEAIKSG